MIRAECVKCHWVFDVAAIPGPVLDVANVCRQRCVCPLCYAGGAVIAPSRPLTDAEQRARGLGALGTAQAAPPTPEPEPPATSDDEAAFWRRHEADGAAGMDAEAWGEWVDALPRNEFLAMIRLGIKAEQEPVDAA